MECYDIKNMWFDLEKRMSHLTVTDRENPALGLKILSPLKTKHQLQPKLNLPSSIFGHYQRSFHSQHMGTNS